MRHTNYDAIASTYDRRYSGDDYVGIERALLDFIGTGPRRVLEVGCGTGHWLQLLTSRNLRAIGLDLSEAMLSFASMNMPDGHLLRGRAEDLAFKSACFDHLFCINAHHHFENKPRFFSEAHRVLRPGGSLLTVALDPNNGADQWWIYDYFEGTLAIDRERYPSCEQIREWMSHAGFIDTYSRVVQHEPDNVAADVALQNGMITPAYTSQLAVLTETEFSEGVKRIQAALAKDHRLSLSADLRVYATYGRSRPHLCSGRADEMTVTARQLHGCEWQ